MKLLTQFRNRFSNSENSGAPDLEPQKYPFRRMRVDPHRLGDWSFRFLTVCRSSVLSVKCAGAGVADDAEVQLSKLEQMTDQAGDQAQCCHALPRFRGQERGAQDDDGNGNGFAEVLAMTTGKVMRSTPRASCSSCSTTTPQGSAATSARSSTSTTTRCKT